MELRTGYTSHAAPKARAGAIKGFFCKLKESKAISAIRNNITWNNATQHMIDTSSILVCSNPIMSFVENVVIGMPDEVSIKARGIASLVAFLGAGSLFSRGRDASRKAFNVGQASSERKQLLHDLCYQMGFTAFNLALYRFCGAETHEMIEGAAFAIGISAVKGPIKGYAIDSFRDLAGIEESSRLPISIKSLSPKVKKGIIAAAIVSSIALMGIIYNSTTPKPPKNTNYDKYSITINNERPDYARKAFLPVTAR